jgi:hypothetical protein
LCDSLNKDAIFVYWCSRATQSQHGDQKAGHPLLPLHKEMKSDHRANFSSKEAAAMVLHVGTLTAQQRSRNIPPEEPALMGQQTCASSLPVPRDAEMEPTVNFRTVLKEDPTEPPIMTMRQVQSWTTTMRSISLPLADETTFTLAPNAARCHQYLEQDSALCAASAKKSGINNRHRPGHKPFYLSP